MKKQKVYSSNDGKSIMIVTTIKVAGKPLYVWEIPGKKKNHKIQMHELATLHTPAKLGAICLGSL